MSTQLVSYNFSTVENPLSDGGNFTTVLDSSFSDALQTIPGHLCESNSGNPSASFYSGLSWPNDQYSEITIATVTNGGVFCVLIRQNAATSGSQYIMFLSSNGGSGNDQMEIIANVGDSFAGLIGNIVMGLTISVNDVWRLSVTGNVFTVTQNGTVIMVATDTDNFISSGSPGFGLEPAAISSDEQVKLWAGGSNGGSSGVWSPVDSRIAVHGFGPGPNQFRIVQAADIYDVQTSDNAAVPGVDSRVSKPVDCRVPPNIPENSRVAPPFGEAGEP